MTLSQHQELPEGNRPKLWFRFVTMREAGTMEELFTEAEKETNAFKMFSSLSEAIGIALIEWEGFENTNGQCCPEGLDSVLDLADMMEIRHRFLTEATQKAMDLKKSGLALLYDAEQFVQSADQQNAQNDQPKQNLSSSNAHTAKGDNATNVKEQEKSGSPVVQS